MHSTQLRVRLAETDQNAVVYYSQYFVYFDVAKTDFLTQAGLDPISLGGRGLRLLAVETGCTFHVPARFRDSLAVSTSVRKLGKSSITFGFEVKRGRELLADGYLVNVLVRTNGRPVRLPGPARIALSHYADERP